MRKVLSLVLVLALVTALCGCGNIVSEKAIVGTWKSHDSIMGVVTETTYIFRADGTGERTGLLTTTFNYEFSGDKLLLTTSVLLVKNTEEYTFRFEGKKLTLTGSKETITLERAD